MTIVKHELRQGRTAFLIWCGAIAALLGICIFLFPEMKAEMDTVSEMFASMGAFTAAFGMDKLNFGTLTGYYAIECGNVLGLGGAFYAAIIAADVLCKEERMHTADFLLTHPVSRTQVMTEKLASVLIRLAVLNALIYGIAVLSMTAVGEEVPWKELNLMHLAYFLLQLELAGLCFGISAFLRRSSVSIGLGIAILMYFMNLIANITESAKDLKYLTPFGFCDGAAIVSEGRLDGGILAAGMALGALGILAAYLKYPKKDIQ